MAIVQNNLYNYFTRYGEPVSESIESEQGGSNQPQSSSEANQTQYGEAVEIDISNGNFQYAQSAEQTNQAYSASATNQWQGPSNSALGKEGEVVIVPGQRLQRDIMDGINQYGEAEEIIRQRMEEEEQLEAAWAREMNLGSEHTTLQDKIFQSEKSALKAALEAIINSPLSRKREIGYFVTKESDGSYKISQAFIGSPLTLKITFNSNEIPRNAIGFIHSHPRDAVIDANGYGKDMLEANKYPSKGTPDEGPGDIEAWNFFERVLNNNQFKMWVVGPDNVVREFNDQSELPPDYLNGNIDATQLPPAPSPVDFQQVP